jgi:hypothetical protein
MYLHSMMMSTTTGAAADQRLRRAGVRRSRSPHARWKRGVRMAVVDDGVRRGGPGRRSPEARVCLARRVMIARYAGTARRFETAPPVAVTVVRSSPVWHSWSLRTLWGPPHRVRCASMFQRTPESFVVRTAELDAAAQLHVRHPYNPASEIFMTRLSDPIRRRNTCDRSWRLCRLSTQRPRPLDPQHFVHGPGLPSRR